MFLDFSFEFAFVDISNDFYLSHFYIKFYFDLRQMLVFQVYIWIYFRLFDYFT